MGSKSSKGAACGRVGRGEKGSEKRKEADHSVSCGQRRTLAFALSERKSCLEALGQCVSWSPALSMAWSLLAAE